MRGEHVAARPARKRYCAVGQLSSLGSESGYEILSPLPKVVAAAVYYSEQQLESPRRAEGIWSLTIFCFSPASRYNFAVFAGHA